ncbi:hypothetical protein [Pseudomonas sp. UMAB-40]|uniref:hypothetical protein n=1 Tax=Pseudomonas sp. UMAB-40 TaxID=1365407 RepID=UPI001C575E87|nr:hypothetical protein [Pseudomonas sp. UMAB-40]
MLQPDSFNILFAPLVLAPLSLAFWLYGWVTRRPSAFAWASIIQCAITAACILYFLFGTIPQNHTAGLVCGLFGGLLFAWVGMTMYKRSTDSK